MEMNREKEVYFGEYCHKCEYEEMAEWDDPCFECLNCPVNIDSHKPVKWKERK